MMGMLVRSVVRALYCFTLYRINRALPLDASYFSYHPNLFVIAVIFFHEAYHVKKKFRPYFLQLTLARRNQLHVALAAIGTYVADYAFYCIYQQKNLAEKAHFTSWHGTVGLIAMSGTLTMHLTGIVAFHWRPKLVTQYHKKASKLVYAAFFGAFALSFWSNWAERNLPPWLKYAIMAASPLYCLQWYHN